MQFRNIIAAAVIGSLASAASATLKDGSYQAQVIGHNAPMTVKVTIEHGKIAAISTKDLESFGVGKTALQVKSEEIIKRQSIGIDAMSGATLSSFALIQGVEECLKAAGATEADIERWSKQTVKHPVTPLTVTGDVAIIGGGGTGLAAAVSALENGAGKVVIIEKLGYLGGSTNVSGGALNAVDDKRQKAQGITDSIETFYNATMKGGHNVGIPLSYAISPRTPIRPLNGWKSKASSSGTKSAQLRALSDSAVITASNPLETPTPRSLSTCSKPNTRTVWSF